MRNLLLAALAASSLLFATAAHADSMYTVSLHEVVGNVGTGTGSFDLNKAPSLVGLSSFKSTNLTGNILESLSFEIGGDTFDLGDAVGGTTVGFFNDTLSDIAYFADTTSRSVQLDFISGGIFYTFTDSLKRETSSGYMVAALVPPAAVTPEPGSLALLGTGLVAGFGMLRRRLA